VALDLGVDTSTPAGELMANVFASFAQFERRLIGVRTREGLAQKKREGVQLGRRRAVPSHVVATIQTMRAKGSTLTAIADTLTANNIPTAHGGARWYASTVRHVLETTQAA